MNKISSLYSQQVEITLQNTNLINKRTETIDNECANMLMQKYGKVDPGLKQLCIDYVSKHVSQP